MGKTTNVIKILYILFLKKNLQIEFNGNVKNLNFLLFFKIAAALFNLLSFLKDNSSNLFTIFFFKNNFLKKKNLDFFFFNNFFFKYFFFIDFLKSF